MNRYEHIKNWRLYAANDLAMEAGHFFISVTTILDCMIDDEERNFYIETNREAFDKIMSSTANTGNEIHEAIQTYASGNSINHSPIVAKCVNNYVEIKEEHNIKIEQFEKRVFSEIYGYAGTLDMIGTCDGRPTVFEIKTGKYKVKAGYQACAYKMAYEELYKDKDHDVAVLKIHRNGREKGLFKYEHIDFCFEAFICAFNLFVGLNYNTLKKLNWKYLNISPIKRYINQLNKKENKNEV